MNSRSVISIDPGTAGTGIAIWKYTDFYLGKPCEPYMWSVMYNEFKILYAIEKLVERLNIAEAYIENAAYMGTSAKGIMVARKGFLIRLASFIGKVEHILQRHGVKVELVSVMDWKGTMSKEAVIKRISKRLPDFQAESHVWDAVGIGLYKMGAF